MEVYLKRTQDYIGEIRNNNFGTPMKIISARNKSDIDIQFLDDDRYIKKHCSYHLFKKGEIKNPYDRKIAGIGYIGVGKYKSYLPEEHHVHAYQIWRMLIVRCYEEKFKETYPTYFEECIVCDEWKNYQNFARWYEENEYSVAERLHIDKDILIPGNKLYSTDTCILLPQKINAMIINVPNRDGLPNGVLKADSGKYYSSYGTKHLGVYNTIEEAFEIHAREKEQAIKNIAEEYKNIIPNKVYKALMGYRCIMEADRNVMRK